MTATLLQAIPTIALTILTRIAQEDPTPTATTEAVVYGVISANGQEQMTATIYQITTGDLLIAVLLLIIAMLLLAILITLVWRRNA